MIAGVTGASSPIGKFLVSMLIAKGWEVRTLTRTDVVSSNPAIRTIKGDIRDEVVLKKLVRGASAIFHCASEFAQEAELWDINVNATKKLIAITKETLSVKYFCYISSAGVLGANSDEWVDEETPCHPRTLYEKSKYAAEMLVMSSDLEAKVCSLRPVFVVSEQRRGFIEYPIRNNVIDKLKLFIKGNECAHVVHAKDVASAAAYFLDAPLEKPECFFVSCDENQLNTVAGISGYYNHFKNGEAGEVKLALSMPIVIPHLIRRLVRGPSLHGRTKFSSAKLKQYGCQLPLGFRGAIRHIIKHSIT